MTIDDRFTRGWIAGATGGLLGSIWRFLAYSLGITTLRLSDWIAILVYGRLPPYSVGDHLHAVVVLSGLTGVIGIIFAFLLPIVKEENMYFKGWVINLIPWWMVYLLTGLFRTEGTMDLPLMTTITDGIGASIAGFATVYMYLLLDPQLSPKRSSSFGLAQPAAKREGSKERTDKDSDRG